jgi:hypothetical protein
MLYMRAEKTSQNRDDFRVLMAGSILTILIMLLGPLVGRGWDEFFATRPFVTATLEVVKVPGQDRPMLLYDADATQFVDAYWIATIEDADGGRHFTRKGEGAYSPSIDNPRLWSWDAFFDNEKGLASPAIPSFPFKVCVRYISTARDSGTRDETPVMCSNTYFP